MIWEVYAGVAKPAKQYNVGGQLTAQPRIRFVVKVNVLEPSLGTTRFATASPFKDDVEPESPPVFALKILLILGKRNARPCFLGDGSFRIFRADGPNFFRLLQAARLLLRSLFHPFASRARDGGCFGGGPAAPITDVSLGGVKLRGAESLVRVRVDGGD